MYGFNVKSTVAQKYKFLHSTAIFLHSTTSNSSTRQSNSSTRLSNSSTRLSNSFTRRSQIPSLDDLRFLHSATPKFLYSTSKIVHSTTWKIAIMLPPNGRRLNYNSIICSCAYSINTTTHQQTRSKIKSDRRKW